MVFLGWHDPDKKKSIATKLEDAIARYTEKWGAAPSEALMNAADADGLTHEVVIIKGVNYIPQNTIYVGEPDHVEAAV